MACRIVGKYELGRVLGAGDFDSRIRMCTHVVTRTQYAVKIYDKKLLAGCQWMWDRVREAVQVMRTLPKHDGIVEMVECFETQSSLYILMQIHSSARITQIYTKEGCAAVPIETTRDYLRQTVHGVLHLHVHNIAHLGLAPDHLMVGENGQLKIGNLVSCCHYTPGRKLLDPRGTTHTVAPEILRGEPYDPELADAWAIGVVLYFMIAGGHYPHDSANTNKHILAHNIRPLPDGVDPDARHLVHALLSMVPQKRLSIGAILDHPFLATGLNEDGGQPSPTNADATAAAKKGDDEDRRSEDLDGAVNNDSMFSSPEELQEFASAEAARVSPPNDDLLAKLLPNSHAKKAAGQKASPTTSPKSKKGPLAPRPPPLAAPTGRRPVPPSASSGGDRSATEGNPADSAADTSMHSGSRRELGLMRKRTGSKGSASGGSGGRGSSANEVRSFWDAKEGLRIVLPEGLSREHDAAYVIQHTFRLFQLLKEPHWDVEIPPGATLGRLLSILRVPRVAEERSGGSFASAIPRHRSTSQHRGSAASATGSASTTPVATPRTVGWANNHQQRKRSKDRQRTVDWSMMGVQRTVSLIGGAGMRKGGSPATGVVPGKGGGGDLFSELSESGSRRSSGSGSSGGSSSNEDTLSVSGGGGTLPDIDLPFSDFGSGSSRGGHPHKSSSGDKQRSHHHGHSSRKGHHKHGEHQSPPAHGGGLPRLAMQCDVCGRMPPPRVVLGRRPYQNTPFSFDSKAKTYNLPSGPAAVPGPAAGGSSAIMTPPSPGSTPASTPKTFGVEKRLSTPSISSR